MRKHFRIPPFAKNAKDGAPTVIWFPQTKGRAARQFSVCPRISPTEADRSSTCFLLPEEN